jgi:tetratricopeptide (TPR) repeat protein
MNEGDLVEAGACFRAALLVDPQSLDARYNLACVLQQSGDLPGAIAAYERCVSDHPEDVESGENLGNLLMETGNYRRAAMLLDLLRARFPARRKLVANWALARWRLRLSEAVAAESGHDVRRILVACMPKSGSTWLADVLAKLPGMQRAHLVADYGRREQELDLEQLVNHQGLSYVSQLHLRPSKQTQELLAGFQVKVVFLYRNIWDVMASLRDHMHTHSMDWSMARIEPSFRGWDEGRQYEFLARAMMPWFIDFYVSWSLEPDRLAVSYEELMADPHATVARIAAWSGIEASQPEIGQALGDTGRAATFNKGGSGRGKAVPEAARAQVRALAAFYPEVDFAPLMGA